MVGGHLELDLKTLCDLCHHNSNTVLVLVEIKLATACEGTILQDYFDSVPFLMIPGEMGRLLSVSFDNTGSPSWACSLELYSEIDNLDEL
jgi:hypothetical protein